MDNKNVAFFKLSYLEKYSSEKEKTLLRPNIFKIKRDMMFDNYTVTNG